MCRFQDDAGPGASATAYRVNIMPWLRRTASPGWAWSNTSILLAKQRGRPSSPRLQEMSGFKTGSRPSSRASGKCRTVNRVEARSGLVEKHIRTRKGKPTALHCERWKVDVHVLVRLMCVPHARQPREGSESRLARGRSTVLGPAFGKWFQKLLRGRL
jgi:hypothetical protein